MIHNNFSGLEANQKIALVAKPGIVQNGYFCTLSYQIFARQMINPRKASSSLLLIAFLFFFLCQSFAQNKTIDSLKAVLPEQQPDSNRVWTLVRLARKFLPLGDSQTVIYGREAYNLAKKLNFDAGKASAAVQLGRFNSQQDKYDEALPYFREAIDIFEKLDDKDGVAACFNNIGILYFYWSKYDSAIANYNRSLSIYEELDIKDEVAKLTSNIGLCYEVQGYYTKALEAYFKALKVDEVTGNQEAVAADLGYIAVVYQKQGDLEKSTIFLEKSLEMYRSLSDPFSLAIAYVNLGANYMNMGRYDEALQASNTALSSFRKLKSPRGESTALHNIGSVYLKQNLYRSAIAHFKKSLSIRPNENDRVQDYVSLAEAYSGLGKPDSALLFARQGLAIAEQLKSHESAFTVAGILYQTYKTKNDHKNALLYHEKYLASKDSLFNNEKTAQFRELQTKYETEKKEQQIAVLNSEKALQESQLSNRLMWLYVSTGATVLIIAFSLVVIRSNKKRQLSEQRLLQEQLKIERMEAEKLQELDELKSRFFANIAHEFKTPLTLISGPVENLLDDSPDKYSKDQLLLVKRNSSRLLSLVNQLLDLSKLESGVTKLELRKDNIITFLKGLTFSFQSLADERDITLECHTSLEKMTMDFDRDKLEKIMFNLLSNAFKFTPSLGSVKVYFEKTSQAGVDYIQVQVVDSGIGIPADQVPFIFNRFYQADNTQIRNSDGSGIGLALTKELVELHGGSVSVESQPGAGATFAVLLPIKDDASVKPFETDAALNLQLSIALLKDPVKADDLLNNNDDREKPELVLVIEDNKEVRDFIINSLKNTYQVVSAATGDEGIETAVSEIPDLIISDVMMPGKNGYETCKILKEDERTSHIPVILLTAKAGFESKMEGLETGADDFIAKPFSTRELLVRIKNLITTRKKLREKYLDTVLTEEKPVTATIEDVFLSRIRVVVEDHLDNPEFSIEDLSREIGMSRTQVHRKLKALTNQSASQFMRSIRLQHGKILLQQGHHNVSEVAYKVGFSSPTYFSTCYTTQFGYAPSEEKVQA